MSYWVYIRCAHCKHSSADFNYTSNLGGMFEWALGRELEELDKMPVSDAIPLLQAAIEKCEADGNLSRFDAPNGWGHGHTALEFLRKICNAALNAPGSYIAVSC
jgi:hypothetical protein